MRPGRGSSDFRHCSLHVVPENILFVQRILQVPDKTLVSGTAIRSAVGAVP